MDRSIVLVSGGMDSAVTAAIALERGPAAFLHVNYGQRTQTRELDAFHGIADFYRVEERLIADIGYLKDIGGSALTDAGMGMPIGDLNRKDIPATYVPFRNAHLLSIAVSWAEVLGVSDIFIGAVEEDGSGYPDCREAFFNAFEAAVALGAVRGQSIKIRTPLIHMRKSAIVKLGLELDAPFHLTWSCYVDSRAACGRCDSCLLRLRGFSEAGAIDAIPYRKNEGYL